MFWEITLYILNFNDFIALYIPQKKINKKYQIIYRVIIIFHLMTKKPL
jgi:hypothetical protein